ncbi:uncharacterized protein LOC129001021 [Macrosteles quadrilineatus]|uniref:uncharacterized protein LOC129001021 n=1 Tax=Macrosteles quadrilineatus TaxID=74068 RepID=UPI0023E1035F|nr:uncharacterized protein LOC129001021 [Macrosteles quadrilineatus]
METLPVEMVVEITSFLTAKDLASCISVSHSWREIFNHELLWKPLCDLRLEEQLSNIPCVVEPAFLISEESTLAPIGQSRLAFIKEKHLWKNWRQNKIVKEKISIPTPKLSVVENLLGLSEFRRKVRSIFVKDVSGSYLQKDKVRRAACLFLTDILLVGWYSNSIRIWDVSSIPAVYLMKTDSSVDVKMWESIDLVGNDTLIVKQKSYVEVFHVDLTNKCIKLRNIILLKEPSTLIVKQHNANGLSIHIGVTVCGFRRKLKVFDLMTGKELIEDNGPVGNETAIIEEILTSTLSDDILVLFQNNETKTAYVYSSEKLCYISGPFLRGYIDQCAINRHYIALADSHGGLKIIDYLTSNVVFSKSEEKKSGYNEILPLLAYKSGFVFLKHRNWNYTLELVSLKNLTTTIVCEQSRLPHYNDCWLDIVNDRFVVVFEAITDLVRSEKTVYEPSANTLQEIVLFGPILDEKFNKSFTKSVSHNDEGNLVISHYW